MTIGYLNQVESVTLNAAGNGSITLSPDTGEYWALSFARIASDETFNAAAASTQGGGISMCTLHQGATNVINFTTQVDSTVLGNGDVTTIIAGTIVQRGESVTAKWTGGVPGAVATLTIYGRTAETLPEIASLLPAIPGARFRGSDASLLVGTDIAYRNQVYNIPANTTVTDTIFNVYTTEGLYLKVDSNSLFACRVRVKSWNGNNFNTLYEVIIPPGFFGTIPPVEIFLPNITSQVQLEFMGPIAGPTSIVVLASSSRNAMGIPLTSFDRNVLFAAENTAVGAGATSQVDIMRVWPGRAQLHIHTPNLATFEVRLYYLNLQLAASFLTGIYAVNQYKQTQEIILPAAPLRLQFQNTTAGAGNYSASIVGGEMVRGEMG